MRLPSLVVFLALLGFSLSGSASAGTAEELTAFANSKYDYCDAKLLGAYWNQSIDEAKARMGRKIGWHDEDVLNGMLEDARTRAQTNGTPTCAYYEAGYSYDDAEALSRFWGMDVPQAKATMQQKIMWGYEDQLRSQLASARAASPATTGNDDETAARRFFDSAYCYCDARVLAALWGGSVWDAKVTIGRKIGWGNQSILDSELVRARQAAAGRGETCDFIETNFTSDDASALATYWKVPVPDAKVRIGNMMMNGRQTQLNAALKSAGAGKKRGKH